MYLFMDKGISYGIFRGNIGLNIGEGTSFWIY